MACGPCLLLRANSLELGLGFSAPLLSTDMVGPLSPRTRAEPLHGRSVAQAESPFPSPYLPGRFHGVCRSVEAAERSLCLSRGTVQRRDPERSPALRASRLPRVPICLRGSRDHSVPEPWCPGSPSVTGSSSLCASCCSYQLRSFLRQEYVVLRTTSLCPLSATGFVCILLIVNHQPFSFDDAGDGYQWAWYLPTPRTLYCAE